MRKLALFAVAILLLTGTIPEESLTADDHVHGHARGSSEYALDGQDTWQSGIGTGVSEAEHVAQYGVACGSPEMSQGRTRECNGINWCDNGQKLMYKIDSDATTQQVQQFDSYCSSNDPPDITAAVTREFQQYKPALAPPQVCPPSRVTLVHIDTVFLTDSTPIDVPLNLLGNAIILKVTGISYQWNYGDGSTHTTETGGWVNPGDPKGSSAKDRLPTGPVSHQYKKSGKDLPVSVTITYNGVFSVNGGQFQPIDGTINATSPSQNIWVRSVDTQLVDPDNASPEPVPTPDPNYPKPTQQDIDTCT